MKGGRMAEENRHPSRQSSIRGAHLDRPRSGRNDPRSGVAVPDHEPAAGGIDLVRMGLEVGTTLGQERHGQHLLRRQPAQLIEIDRRKVGLPIPVGGGILD